MTGGARNTSSPKSEKSALNAFDLERLKTLEGK
jgi:hypothetical protein